MSYMDLPPSLGGLWEPLEADLSTSSGAKLQLHASVALQRFMEQNGATQVFYWTPFHGLKPHDCCRCPAHP